MSNKIVPTVYRGIIDDVISSVQVDFEEYGIGIDILQELQGKWEEKLLATRVAEFNGPQRDRTPDSPDEESSNVANGTPSRANGTGGGNGNAAQQVQGLALPGLALPGGLQNGYNGADVGSVKAEPDDTLRLRGGASSEAGPSGTSGSRFQYEPLEEALRLRGGASSGDDRKPYAYNPDTDVKPEPNAAGLLPGDEVIDSDLDDSDEEGRDDDDERGEGWEGDIVFCVWDKVQRVKNKWKTTFKDGMIHVNGKDYLFAKCSGEFEW